MPRTAVSRISMRQGASAPQFLRQTRETDVFDQFIRSGQLPVSVNLPARASASLAIATSACRHLRGDRAEKILGNFRRLNRRIIRFLVCGPFELAGKIIVLHGVDWRARSDSNSRLSDSWPASVTTLVWCRFPSFDAEARRNQASESRHEISKSANAS